MPCWQIQGNHLLFLTKLNVSHCEKTIPLTNPFLFSTDHDMILAFHPYEKAS